MDGDTEDRRPAAAPGDEPVEVVERDRTVVGLVTRAEMRARRLRHRSVFVAVLDSRGRLLVHRRADHKDAWPGWWDVSVGGVLSPGEDWHSGAARELSEELGVHGTSLAVLGDGIYEDPEVALVGRCFVTVCDGPFSCPDGEVAETRWVNGAELREMLSVRRFLPDGLALVLPRLEGFRNLMP